MRYDTACDTCGYTGEIEKRLTEALPPCPDCGCETRQVYSPPGIILAAPGFYHTDYARLESQVGRERAERFRAQRADAESRAKAGRLTEYERELETI